jgi:hypothetical protein
VIIATSPIVHEPGTGIAARRIVLRQFKCEFVVHAQRFYEDGSTGFDHGDYFLFKADEKASVLDKAWKCFVERSERQLEYPIADIESDPVRFAFLK